MKARGKAGGGKSATKDVPRVIKKLGLAVPPTVREAYLALVKAEPGKREDAIKALEIAGKGDLCTSSSLAIAKGYVYLAMDVAGTKTKEPYKQMERDEKICGYLMEAAKHAALGAKLYDSQLCTILGARIISIVAEVPYYRSECRRFAGQIVHSSQVDPIGDLLKNELIHAGQRLPLLSNFDNSMLGREVIPEDMWPFEELACSSSERLKQMLDNTRYMLRSTAFAVDRYDFVINYKYFKSLHQKTDLLPASGDHQKLTETFKAYLRKTDNDLARSLAVSPFAPREEALRLARRLSDSVHAKVKEAGSADYWMISIVQENTKMFKELAQLGDTKQAPATAAVSAPVPAALTEEELQREKELLQKENAALATAARRADAVKNYLEMRAAEEKNANGDVGAVIQNEVAMDIDRFLKELEKLYEAKELTAEGDIEDYLVVKEWNESGRAKDLWYTLGEERYETRIEFQKAAVELVESAMDTDEFKKEARAKLQASGILIDSLSQPLDTLKPNPSNVNVLAPLSASWTTLEASHHIETEYYTEDLQALLSAHWKRQSRFKRPPPKDAESSASSSKGSGAAYNRILKSMPRNVLGADLDFSSSSTDEYLDPDDLDLGEFDEFMDDIMNDPFYADDDSQKMGTGFADASIYTAMDEISLAKHADAIITHIHQYMKLYPSFLYSWSFMDLDKDLNLSEPGDVEKRHAISLNQTSIHFALVGLINIQVALTAHAKELTTLQDIADCQSLSNYQHFPRLLQFAVTENCASLPDPKYDTLASYAMKEYIEIVEKRGVRESLFGVSRSVIAFIVQLRHNPKLLEEGARPPTIQDVAEIKGLMAEMVVEGLRNFSEFGRLTASMRSMITDWLMLKLKKVHRGLGAGELESDEEGPSIEYEGAPLEESILLERVGCLSLGDLERLLTYVCILTGCSFETIGDMERFRYPFSVAACGGRFNMPPSSSKEKESKPAVLAIAPEIVKSKVDQLLYDLQVAEKELGKEQLPFLSNTYAVHALWSANLSIVANKDKGAGQRGQQARGGAAPTSQLLEWLPSSTKLRFWLPKPASGPLGKLTDGDKALVYINNEARNLGAGVNADFELWFPRQRFILEVAQAMGQGGLGAFGDDLADISLKVMEAIEFGIRQLRVTYMAYEVAVGLEAAVQGKGSHLPSITHGTHLNQLRVLERHLVTWDGFCNALYGQYADESVSSWPSRAQEFMKFAAPTSRVLQEVSRIFDGACIRLHKAYTIAKALDDSTSLVIGKRAGMIADECMKVPIASAFRLMSGQVLPRLWEEELNKQKEKEENARKSAADALADELMAEEENEKKKKEAAAKKKAKKKAKKASAVVVEEETTSTGAAAAETEESKEDQEGTAEREVEQEEEESANGGEFDEDDVSDLMGMLQLRGSQNVSGSAPSPAPHRPTSSHGAQHAQQTQKTAAKAKIFSWDGRWTCQCRKIHELSGSCSRCNVEVCKAFVEGRPCPRQPCRYVHPAFGLTSREPPATLRPGSIIVRNTEAWARDSQERWEAIRRQQSQNVRVIGWDGSWLCQCEDEHDRFQGCSHCTCGGVCLAYLKGNCFKTSCRFEHPPFALDPATRPREGVVKDEPFVVLTPESLMWKNGHIEKLGSSGAGAGGGGGGSGGSSRVVTVSMPRPAPLPSRPAPPQKSAAGKVVTVPLIPGLAPDPPRESKRAAAGRQKRSEIVAAVAATEEGWSIDEPTSHGAAPAGRIPSSTSATSAASATTTPLGGPSLQQYHGGTGQQQQQQQQQYHPQMQTQSPSQFPPLFPSTVGTNLWGATPASASTATSSGGGLGSSAFGVPVGQSFANGVLPPPDHHPSVIGGGAAGMAALWGPPVGNSNGTTPSAGPGVYTSQHNAGMSAPSLLPHLYPTPSTDSTDHLSSVSTFHMEPSLPESLDIGIGISPIGAAAVPAEQDDYSSMLADLGVASEGGGGGTWRNAVMHTIDDEIGRVSAPGLANEAGEYNCFLNVVIQCLWHCKDFRTRVMTWPPRLYLADPVVHALRNLFNAFAQQEAERASASHNPGVPRAVVNPSELREALATLPGRSFGLGEMNDAAELLMTLYSCAHEVGPEGAAAIDATFGLRVRESVRCPHCRRRDGSPLDTHENDYVQYFFNVSATALRMVRAAYGAAASTAQLLRQIEEQTMKSCDTEKGGCDAKLHVRHTLVNIPSVFTLQLAWETNCEAPEDIRATLDAVQEKTKLGELYADVEAQAPLQPYWLRAAVAYYGAHYSAFVYSTELKAWIMFDDSAVSKIGNWADVVRKCQIGRIQPSVLFYSQR